VLQPSLVKRNLVPRFTKGGGAQENNEDDLMLKKREWNIKTIEKRKVFLGFHAASLFMIGPFHHAIFLVQRFD
jgi:hypothetical protein